MITYPTVIRTGATSTLNAVLLDMDGTLTDSERLWGNALRRSAADLGRPLTPAARATMSGQAFLTTVARLHDFTDAPGSYLDTAELLTGHIEEEFRNGVDWRPGARDFLHAVRAAGLRTALVTATNRPLVEIALAHTLGAENFDVTVAGNEVANGKPHPEPYLRAIQLLGLTPDTCVAVEDTPNGATSAQAAGVPVLVVPCELDVPAAPGRVLLPSLDLATVDLLHRIRHDQRLAA